ncbi:MAG TPA: hypothetical protein VGM93_08925 [Acidimicrobiales bacterium]
MTEEAQPAPDGASGRWKPPQHRTPWWERKAPSFLTFVVLLLVVALVTVALAVRVKDTLHDVGRDQAGSDPWTLPVGVEVTKYGFLIGHIPACEQSPVERIELWDANSKVLWEVAGPPTPMATFTIGFAPQGFKTIHPYTEPGPSALVRVVVVRRLAGVIGGRYVKKDLSHSANRVTVFDGAATHVYTSDGFRDIDYCSDKDKASASTIPPAGAQP